jgi:hypothetical protein
VLSFAHIVERNSASLAMALDRGKYDCQRAIRVLETGGTANEAGDGAMKLR